MMKSVAGGSGAEDRGAPARAARDRQSAGLPQLADFRSAVIIKPSSLGDIVHALPAVHAIRQAHPHLRLRWLANREWLPLLEDSAVVDEVIEFPRQSFRGLRGLSRALDWARHWRRLPREEPEVVLDFQGLLRSGWVARTRGSRPVIGLSDAREGAGLLYDHRIRVDPLAHAVDRYLELPRALGVPLPEHLVCFPLPRGIQPAGLADRADLIVIHPWSRGRAKSLPPAVLQELCTRLKPWPVVLVGSRGNAELPRGPHIFDLSGQTSLSQLVWVLRRAAFNISVDSGPMHIAAAVNDQTLGIHTWTDPRQVGPYNLRAAVWKAGRIAPRDQLPPDLCLTHAAPTVADAAAMADFVLASIRSRHG